MEKNNKVVVGMSGGVDSSVAAYILKNVGYEVIGVNMGLWEAPDSTAVEDAKAICETLDIPFHVVDYKDDFNHRVIEKFLDEYEMGRTPNPCIECNKYLKFGRMLEKAKELGAYYIATGHYANIFYDEKLGRYMLKEADNSKKDQTYALYHLRQDQLKHILFPLGEVSSKEEVRAIATKINVKISEKGDSQEICFIPDNDYPGFVSQRRNTGESWGEFVNMDGEVLGNHKGIINYTVGQRKGLGITFGKPTYVIGIDPGNNRVILGSNEDVFSKGLIGSNANFIPFDELKGELIAEVKIRYSARPAKCTITMTEDNRVRVIFDEPQRAVTPGQAAVFYNGDILIGGVTIDKSIKI